MPLWWASTRAAPWSPALKACAGTSVVHRCPGGFPQQADVCHMKFSVTSPASIALRMSDFAVTYSDSLPHQIQRLAVDMNSCYKSRAYRCISTLNHRQLNSWKVLSVSVIKLLTWNAHFSSLSLLNQKCLFHLLRNCMYFW